MNIRRREKGFTLIELLIVITIIGILAVAFLPSMLGAPSKARDVQRMNDVKAVAGYLMAQSLSGSSGGSAFPSTYSFVLLKTHFYNPTAIPPVDIRSSFGGRIPAAPKRIWYPNTPAYDNYTDYFVYKCPSSAKYQFVVSTKVELPGENGNSPYYDFYSCSGELKTPAITNSPTTTTNFFIVPIQK